MVALVELDAEGVEPHRQRQVVAHHEDHVQDLALVVVRHEHLPGHIVDERVQEEGISGAEQGRLGWRPEPRRGALGQRGELRLAKPRIRGGDLDVLAPLVGAAGQPSGTQDEDLTGMDRQRALEQEVIGEDDPATEQAWMIGQGAHDIQDLSEAAWSFKAGPQLGVPLGERERGDARRGQALCGHWSPRLRVGLS